MSHAIATTLRFCRMCLTCGDPERPKSARGLLRGHRAVGKGKDATDDSHVCPICSEKSDQCHQIHYGGLACFSCKAFFRRAHQKTKHPEFVCKKSGTCDVGLKNRRKCQKCRYTRCLLNGMNPKAVLNEDQKKVRFRNSLKKKEARDSLNVSSREFIESSEDSSSDDDSVSNSSRRSSTAKSRHRSGTSDSGLESAHSPTGSYEEEPEEKKVKLESSKEDVKQEDNDALTMSEEYSHDSIDATFSEAGDNIMSAITPRFTYDEEHWLQGQFALLQTCYESVSLGEEYMKEFAMYSLGVPLSKNFMSHSVAVCSERFTRVLIHHPEVASLPESKKRLLCQMSILNGVALNFCKLETCDSGEEQLKFACGMWDDIIWKKDFQNFFVHRRKLKKVTMADTNKTTGQLSHELVTLYTRLANSIGSYTKDPEMYKLMIFVVLLFQEDVASMASSVARLRDQYINILRRRQTWLMVNHWYDENDEDEEAATLINHAVNATLNTCLCEVKEVANIIMNL